MTLGQAIEAYVRRHRLSECRASRYATIGRVIGGYEIGRVSADTLGEMAQTLADGRGGNTVANMMAAVKAVLGWCRSQGWTACDPFVGYDMPGQVYGTPYYITSDERNTIAAFDLSKYPRLAVQRDIFVLQCMLGCRISDLMAMTADNVVDGAIEYVARKTRRDRPVVIRVPLHPYAGSLIAKYGGGERLMPFISVQRYNRAIKRILRICGVTRPVTVIDPRSGEAVRRPICDVASSHMARRAFIGNLYCRVKDPELIASMSGHAPGSKAFARYRTIDDEVKREVVMML